MSQFVVGDWHATCFAAALAIDCRAIRRQSTDKDQRMSRPTLMLQPSEGIVAQAAAAIYAAYIAAGRVPEGQEQAWIRRSIQESFPIARLTDEAIHSDGEVS
jgi:hypothetical protein